jgi:hypothetical protein
MKKEILNKLQKVIINDKLIIELNHKLKAVHLYQEKMKKDLTVPERLRHQPMTI